jgi:hypothetical protein
MNARRIRVALAASLLLATWSSAAVAALSITPISWNVVGLDSNDVNSGPNRFPVGARVCSDVSTGANDVIATFAFEPGGSPHINLRGGSANPINLGPMGINECRDAYFEAEITRTAAAYDTTRLYTITAVEDNVPANTVTTPTPRELYVERLISQNRNSIQTVSFGPIGGPLTNVNAGGALNLAIGETYDIRITGGTATQGYEQFSAFAGLTNTVFRIIAVQTTLSADTSNNVVTPNDLLYADACVWENDPGSPNYRGCNASGKAGGDFSTTYSVEIISPAAASDSLFSLIYDFSGSSYHYNSDYDSGGRIINIIDPNSAGFVKAFLPSTIGENGVSTLRFTISNPNAVAVSGYNFVDNLPGGLLVATPPNANLSGCGAASFAPVAGAGSISFANGTVAANSSCVVTVQVTGALAGAYNNISNNLFVGMTDTGVNATATLTITDVPPLPVGQCAPGTAYQTLARWEMNPAQGLGTPPDPVAPLNPLVSTASANFVGPANNISTTGNPANGWRGNGWPTTNAGLTSTFTSYFDFTVDTSRFSAVRMGLQSIYEPNGAWTAGNNQGIVVYTTTGGIPFVGSELPVFAVQNLSKNQWNTIPATSVVATTTGTSTTTFRVT